MSIWPEGSDNLIASLRRESKPQRFAHVLGVLETALVLAEAHELELAAAAWAALMHDACKSWGHERCRAFCRVRGLPVAEEDLDYPGLWHAWAAAARAQIDFGLEQEDILNAIRYHPTGRPGMSLCEKVLFVADYTEPTRGFDGAQALRNQAFLNLDLAVLGVLEHKIGHMRAEGIPIHPRAQAALKDLETNAGKTTD